MSRQASIFHPRKKITTPSLQRPLWFVSKMAVMEQFDCILHKRSQLGEF